MSEVTVEPNEDLPQYLRRLADSKRSSVEANVLRKTADEILRLRRTVYRYRWEKLAEGLVICIRKLDRLGDDEPRRIRERVVHVAGCRHIPDTNVFNTLGRMDGTQWFVHDANGDALYMAVRDGARICGTCRPNVDVEGVID